MNEFKVCDICEADISDSLIAKLKEIDSQAEIIVGCHGFCNLGKPFVIVNGIPAIGETEDEVINKVKEMLSN